MRKIKWINVVKVLVLMAIVSLLAHDFYVLAIQPFYTGELTGYTWCGLATVVFATMIGTLILEDLVIYYEK